MAAVVHTIELDLFKNDYLLLGEFIDFFCGRNLGEGQSRIVYDYNPDKKYVIKIDKSKWFNNIEEYELYTLLKKEHPKSAEFLAPVYQISQGGKIMLQRKTTPIKDFKHFPKKIPAFLSDVKIQNWGILNNKLVCHDYANNKIAEIGYKAPFIKPIFWSDIQSKFFNKEKKSL